MVSVFEWHHIVLHFNVRLHLKYENNGILLSLN